MTEKLLKSKDVKTLKGLAASKLKYIYIYISEIVPENLGPFTSQNSLKLEALTTDSTRTTTELTSFLQSFSKL